MGAPVSDRDIPEIGDTLSSEERKAWIDQWRHMRGRRPMDPQARLTPRLTGDAPHSCVPDSSSEPFGHFANWFAEATAVRWPT